MLVTLTSDFGWENEGPGVMAATVLGICPGASVVHLTHGVTPYSILEGARQMECVTTIPKGIHVCVVDPGVGSERLCVVLDVPGVGYLVGPDNGVLIPAAKRGGGIREVRAIENRSLIRHPTSTTFHGRDIFSSVAGHLARGVPFEEVGGRLDAETLVPAPYADATFAQGHTRATVIHINRYGNCILNISEEEVYGDSLKSRSYRLITNEGEPGDVQAVACFSSVPVGDALLYPDSYGRVALALNQGNASHKFHLNLGDEFELALMRYDYEQQ
jgi:S-adenosylmethionine hydrolase